MSRVHLGAGMLGRGMCAAVACVPRAGGNIVFFGAARACCRVTVGGGAFGCADTPCGLVSCAGEAIVGSLDWP